MGAILELDPLNLWNFQEEREHRNLLHLIETSGDEKSRTSNIMNYPGDIPVLQIASRRELKRT